MYSESVVNRYHCIIVKYNILPNFKTSFFVLKNPYFRKVKNVGKYFLKLWDLSIKIYPAAIKGEE